MPVTPFHNSSKLHLTLIVLFSLVGCGGSNSSDSDDENQAPIAQDDNLATDEDTAMNITLAATDIDGSISSFNINTQPGNGVLTGTAPNLNYTPNPDFFGNDSFTFNVTDSDGLESSSATIAIDVNPVNDIPSFSAGTTRWVNEDAGAQSFDAWSSAISSGPANELTQVVSFILSNDNTALFLVQPAVSADGTLSFTTAANAFGHANVSIQIQDNAGTTNGGEDISATQNFVIRVLPQNDAISIITTGLPAGTGATANTELATDAFTAGLLQYDWQASGDWSISGGQATSQLSLLAPANSSSDSVSLSATSNTTADLIADLPLSLSGDNTPVISQLAVTPLTGTDAWHLDVSASDPNMLALSYDWTSAGLSVGNTATSNWTPPISGQYRLTANADNTSQNASGSIEIWHTSRAPGMFFRGSRQGTGSRYPIDTSANNGQQKWKRVITSANCTASFNFVSGLAQGQDGTLYLSASNEPRLYAIDPENGDVQWFFEATGSDFRSTPAIAADGTIYVVERVSGTVYAVNPNGSEAWNYSIGVGVGSPIALGADGSLYIGTDNGAASVLLALNADGSEKWTTPFALNRETRSSVNFGADGTIYARTYEGYIYAIDPDTGSQIWRSPLLGGGSGSSPVVAADGSIYFGSFVAGDKLFALNADGTLKWGSDLGNTAIVGIGTTASIGSEGTVYIGAWEPGSQGGMYALNSTDGSQLWRHALNGVVQSSSSAIGADGHIYVASQRGILYALDPATGNESWTYDFEAAPNEESPGPLLIAADGTIYIYTCDGAVHAIE